MANKSPKCTPPLIIRGPRDIPDTLDVEFDSLEGQQASAVPELRLSRYGHDMEVVTPYRPKGTSYEE